MGGSVDSGPAGNGGAILDASSGGAPDDAGSGGSGCQPGQYTGSFDGTHHPAITFNFAPVSVKVGTVSFALQGTGGALTVHSGKLDATLTNLVVPNAGTLTATLTGKFDCSTGHIVDGHLTGQIDVVNVFTSTISGSWDGAVDPAGAFSGTWTESEPQLPAAGGAGAGGGSGTGAPACVPPVSGTGGTIGYGTGCGTWNAQ